MGQRSSLLIGLPTVQRRRFGKCYIRFDWIGEEGSKVQLQRPTCLVCLEDGSSVRIGWIALNTKLEVTEVGI